MDYKDPLQINTKTINRYHETEKDKEAIEEFNRETIADNSIKITTITEERISLTIVTNLGHFGALVPAHTDWEIPVQ